jgi:glycosyltransferase involved in cell wall biosynthesis
MFFSIIIPLYNRPQEIDELLGTLTLQTYKQFEVLVIEDGSTKRAEDIVKSYADRAGCKIL